MGGQGFQFSAELLTLAHELVLGFAVLVKAHDIIEIGDPEPLEPALAEPNLAADRLLLRLARLCFTPPHLLRLVQQTLGRPVVHRHPREKLKSLLRNKFLAREGLRARLALFRTSQVVMALVLLRGDEVAALTATDRAGVQEASYGLLGRMTSPLHHLLALVEERSGDQWLVRAVVQLALVDHDTGVERILQQLLDTALALPAAARDHGHPEVKSQVAKLSEGETACGVLLKERADDRGVDRVRIDPAGLGIVDVAQGRKLGPDPFLYLAIPSSQNVLAQTVYIVLGLAERHHECELALRSGLCTERRESQLLDLARIHKLHDLTGVERVSGETVGCPGEQTIGLALLDSLEHVVEHRAPGHLGALAFDKLPDHPEFLAFDQLADLGELITDRTKLT